MTVMDNLREMIASKGTLHMALIDPDKQPPEEAGRIAERMLAAGSDEFKAYVNERISRMWSR